MFKIDSLVDQFKEVSEWKDFAESLQKTILDLTHKNKALIEEVEHLRKLLESTTPMLVTDKSIGFATDDEETICRMEIAKLRDRSAKSELNYEESKKLDTYVSILLKLRQQPKTIQTKAKALTTDELNKLADSTRHE